MSDWILCDETREKLKKVSTASVATALYKRGLRNQFVQGVVPVERKPVTMVGQAFTLRYIPAREDRNPIEVFRDRGHKQRVAVETCPAGHVLVMDARKDSRAATAGSPRHTAAAAAHANVRPVEGQGRARERQGLPAD